MNNQSGLENIYHQIYPHTALLKGENIPEFYKVNGYYAGYIKNWDNDLKKGIIGGLRNFCSNLYYSFTINDAKGLTLEDINNMHNKVKDDSTQSYAPYLLFKPGFDKKNPKKLFCSEVTSIFSKSSEIAIAVFEQNNAYYLQNIMQIPEIRNKYILLIHEEMEKYVQNFNESDFIVKECNFIFSNTSSRSPGQDDYRENASYNLTIHSDLYLLSLIRKIIFYNKDRFSSKLGEEIKTEVGKDLGFDYGHFSLFIRLTYTDDSIEYHRSKKVALKDSFFLKYSFLEYYNREEHLLYLKSIDFTNFQVWDTNKIIPWTF
jgi:hypothetical protein